MNLRSTSFRTFVLTPLVWLRNDGQLSIQPWFLPLLAWGYLRYRLISSYRTRRGGGGPGMNVPPERLVTTGPYAWCRNPIYLGHIIFLAGLTLTFRSVVAALITAVIAVWFHFRVQRDERRLRERFGHAYEDYCARVGRWSPRPSQAPASVDESGQRV